MASYFVCAGGAAGLGSTLAIGNATGGGAAGNQLWLIMPGLAIIVVVMGFTLVGHALEAVLNPKLRQR